MEAGPQRVDMHAMTSALRLTRAASKLTARSSKNRSDWPFVGNISESCGFTAVASAGLDQLSDDYKVAQGAY